MFRVQNILLNQNFDEFSPPHCSSNSHLTRQNLRTNFLTFHLILGISAIRLKILCCYAVTTSKIRLYHLQLSLEEILKTVTLEQSLLWYPQLNTLPTERFRNHWSDQNRTGRASSVCHIHRHECHLNASNDFTQSKSRSYTGVH